MKQEHARNAIEYEHGCNITNPESEMFLLRKFEKQKKD